MLVSSCPDCCNLMGSLTSIHAMRGLARRHVDLRHPYDFAILRDGMPVELKTVRVLGYGDLTEYLISPKVDDLGSRSNRKHGAWCEEKGRNGNVEVYSSCAACGTVNRITDIPISPGGITTCHNCTLCKHAHGFVQRCVLEGWEDHRRYPTVWWDARIVPENDGS